MSKLPDPIPSLRGELADIRRQLRRMQSASPFFGTPPTRPGALYAWRTNFGLTTTLTNILTTTVTVPDTFTVAHIVVAGRVFAYNNTAALDYLHGQTNIAGYNGIALPLAVSGSNGSGTNHNTFATQLTDLTPGSTFDVQMAASTSFGAWATNAANTADLSGLITWYR